MIYAKELNNARARLDQLEEQLVRHARLAEPDRANQFQVDLHAAIELLMQVMDDSEHDDLKTAQNVCKTYVRRFLAVVQGRLDERPNLPPNEVWPLVGIVGELRRTSFHQELCDDLINRIATRIKELGHLEEKRR